MKEIITQLLVEVKKVASLSYGRLLTIPPDGVEVVLRLSKVEQRAIAGIHRSVMVCARDPGSKEVCVVHGYEFLRRCMEAGRGDIEGEVVTFEMPLEGEQFERLKFLVRLVKEVCDFDPAETIRG